MSIYPRIARQSVAVGLFLMLNLMSATGNAEEQRLFTDDTVLKAVLTAPIAQVYAQKRQDMRLYFPGQWTYMDTGGETRRLEVSIRTRGNFRREYCNLPPLQLNFKKSQVRETLFDGQNKLKMVAPCKHGDKYQQYIVLEYLAYQTFQIITDVGFRTRLIRLSYVDSDEKLKPWTDYTFLIEDESNMANRLGLQRLRVPAIEYHELDHAYIALVQMFQFLIGNNDYSVLRGEGDNYCCHNTEVLGLEETDGGLIPIPFDFDMSGMVNADYALPPRQIPIEDVRRRYFYGLCQPTDILDDAIRHMQSKRDAIVALYENTAELDANTREKSLEYVKSFYNILKDSKTVEKEIIARCRGEDVMRKMFESPRDPT